MNPFKHHELARSLLPLGIKGRFPIGWAGRACGAAAIALLAACGTAPTGGEYAEQVYLNGKVYAVPLEGRSVEAFAVNGDRFSAVGDGATIRQLIGPRTKVVDLQGRAVVPGLIDAHAHHVRGALRVLYSCEFRSTLPADQVPARVKACAEARRAGEWVTGGAWSKGQMSGDHLSRQALDRAAPNNPVLLLEDTGHGALANSRALELLGIVGPAAASNPEVLKDSTGQPTGILTGTTSRAVTAKLPPPTDEEYKNAVLWGAKQSNSFGLTTYAEARVDRRTLAAYKAVDVDGNLTANVVAYLQYETEFEPHEREHETFRIRASMRTKHVSVDFIKLYLDGVPPNYSAALLTPYTGTGHDHGADFKGKMQMPQRRIDEIVTAMDKAGVSVKMHATGDGSVHAALDAVETARRANSLPGVQHSIAHVGLVSPEDLVRFKTLNVAADIAPPIWIPGPYSASMLAALGKERYENYIPVADLVKADARVIYGSDWPAIAFSFNPWPHLQSMVDRSIGTHQRIDLRTAIHTMTGAAAAHLGLSSRLGSIEKGKSANFLILSADPFQVPTSAIGAIAPMTTVFEGNEVFRKTN